MNKYFYIPGNIFNELGKSPIAILKETIYGNEQKPVFQQHFKVIRDNEIENMF